MIPFLPRRRPRSDDDAHAHARSLISDRLDAPLDADRSAWLEAHLADCDVCTAVVAEYESQRSLLRALPAPEPPRDLWARTRAGIEQQREPRLESVATIGRPARSAVRRPRRRRRRRCVAAGLARSGAGSVAVLHRRPGRRTRARHPEPRRSRSGPATSAGSRSATTGRTPSPMPPSMRSARPRPDRIARPSSRPTARCRCRRCRGPSSRRRSRTSSSSSTPRPA